MDHRLTRKPRLFRRRPRLPWTPARLLVLLFALLAGPACAGDDPEGLVLRDDEGRWIATLAMDTSVDVQVRGLLAEVGVRQTYRNDSSQWREGRYLLPLPEDAAVGALTLRVGDRLVEGEIREKAEAEAVYAAAAAAGQRASLVSLNRPNLFQTAVANIGPGEEVEIEVRYWQPVAYRDGVFSLHLPLTLTPRYTPAGDEPGAKAAAAGDPEALPAVFVAGDAGAALPPTVALQAEIVAGLPLRTVDSPSHAVTVHAEGDAYRVTLANLVEASDRDFVLRWEPEPSRAPRQAVFTDRIAGEDFALLMLVPPTLPTAPLPRELVLVVDTSGSMAGTSMQQAIAAADAALARLRPGDRFDVIRFDDDLERLFAAPVPAEPGNVARARAFVRGFRAEGGTEMLPALREAFAGAPAPGFLRQVVLATDAAIGNETELLSLVESERGEARLFPVGIGSAPNGYFLRKAAETGRGSATVIRDVNEVAQAMDGLLARLDAPAMRDIAIDWPGRAEAYPARIPDLYRGEALQVVARLDALEGTATVRGLLPQPWVRQVRLDGGTPAAGVNRLWGRARIDFLEDEMRRGGETEALRASIVDVALRHGLASRFTSLVAVDRTPARPAGESLGSTRMLNATPEGSLAFAQGSTGWERGALLAMALALAGLWLAGTRR